MPMIFGGVRLDQHDLHTFTCNFKLDSKIKSFLDMALFQEFHFAPRVRSWRKCTARSRMAKQYLD